MYTINFATYFQLLFSLFKLLFSLFKKKKKNYFSLYYFTSTVILDFSNLSPSSLPHYLSTTLYFTIKLPSSFFLSYILTILLPIIFV